MSACGLPQALFLWVILPVLVPLKGFKGVPDNPCVYPFTNMPQAVKILCKVSDMLVYSEIFIFYTSLHSVEAELIFIGFAILA